MSFGYMSRVMWQAGTRAVQGMKDQGSKCADTTVKSLRDSCSSSSSSSSSSSKQARRFSCAVDSSSFKAAREEKLKLAEESLRTVMYLSCWGPN